MAVKNIIFDFGGVICDIDISLTEQAFIDLGIKSFKGEDASAQRDLFFEQFETGQISPPEFRSTLRMFFSNPVSDEDIDRAWNALLHKIPANRISLLKKLQSRYKLFLLSNTNPIHYQQYVQDLHENFGFHDFHGLFETAYFSHEIQLRKPSREVYEFVLNHAGIRGEETLFIDDDIRNTQGAGKAGILAYHLKPDEDITELFNTETQFLPIL